MIRVGKNPEQHIPALDNHEFMSESFQRLPSRLHRLVIADREQRVARAIGTCELV